MSHTHIHQHVSAMRDTGITEATAGRAWHTPAVTFPDGLGVWHAVERRGQRYAVVEQVMEGPARLSSMLVDLHRDPASAVEMAIERHIAADLQGCLLHADVREVSEQGVYVGPIAYASQFFCLQQVGDHYRLHHCADLDTLPAVGESVGIRYQSGRGSVFTPSPASTRRLAG